MYKIETEYMQDSHIKSAETTQWSKSTLLPGSTVLWVSYHKLRLKNLKDLWKTFGHDLGLAKLEPILEQTVLDSVLDLLIRKHTQDSKTSSGSGSSISQSREYTLSHRKEYRDICCWICHQEH